MIGQNEIIEIHFFHNNSTLNYFFSEKNSQSMFEVDLSHFDSSLVKNMDSMFYLTSIEKINFTNFNTSLVRNMGYLFYQSSNLKSLDLSNFKTSRASNLNYLFDDMDSLEYLDISNFYFSRVDDVSDIFDSDNKNIKYLNLYNAKNYDSLLYYITINNGDKYILNQKENIHRPENAILINFDTNNKPIKYESNNYIIIKFKDTVNYTSGFINEDCTSRNKISHIIYQDSIFGAYNTGPLIFEANNQIEIHFPEPIDSLENIFNCELDINSKSINYVDFSNFNSSLVNNINNMLHNCPSIEYLDISNFDPININNADSMFDNFENIKYINLNNMTNDYIISRIKSSNLKNKNDLIVCQNNNKPIIDNVNAIYDCLYFEENSLKSDSNNYITVKYNNESKYTSGFKLDNIKTRKEINYIIYQDSIFINDNPFIIEANKSIEIHFTNIIDNLENFFNDELDSNCRNIISIDLSYFNSTLIGNIDNIFSNCTSLSYLDISNFDFGKIASSNSISSLFSDLENIVYINLSNIKNYDSLKKRNFRKSKLKHKK